MRPSSSRREAVLFRPEGTFMAFEVVNDPAAEARTRVYMAAPEHRRGADGRAFVGLQRDNHARAAAIQRPVMVMQYGLGAKTLGSLATPRARDQVEPLFYRYQRLRSGGALNRCLTSGQQSATLAAFEHLREAGDPPAAAFRNAGERYVQVAWPPGSSSSFRLAPRTMPTKLYVTQPLHGSTLGEVLTPEFLLQVARRLSQDGDDAGRRRDAQVACGWGLLYELSSALAPLHGRGFVHGDVSEGNICLRLRDRDPSEASDAPSAGQLLVAIDPITLHDNAKPHAYGGGRGTLHVASYEQATLRYAAAFASDVWQIAAVVVSSLRTLSGTDVPQLLVSEDMLQADGLAAAHSRHRRYADYADWHRGANLAALVSPDNARHNDFFRVFSWLVWLDPTLAACLFRLLHPDARRRAAPGSSQGPSGRGPTAGAVVAELEEAMRGGTACAGAHLRAFRAQLAEKATCADGVAGLLSSLNHEATIDELDRMLDQGDET